MRRRSASERTRAAIRSWMPMDGRQATLLGLLAMVALMFALLLH
jgi:hypothetical protein